MLELGIIGLEGERPSSQVQPIFAEPLLAEKADVNWTWETIKVRCSYKCWLHRVAMYIAAGLLFLLRDPLLSWDTQRFCFFIIAPICCRETACRPFNEKQRNAAVRHAGASSHTITITTATTTTS